MFEPIKLHDPEERPEFAASAMHLSRMAWLLFGALACVACVLNAVVEGSSALAIVIGPLLVFLWLAAVLVVDRWVTRGANQPE